MANGDSCVTETEFVRVRRDAVPEENPEETPEDAPFGASSDSRSAAAFCRCSKTRATGESVNMPCPVSLEQAHK